jgi:hypothetical protein
MKASKLRDGNDPEFYASTERLGHSTRRAIEDAKAWRYSAESGDSAY